MPSPSTPAALVLGSGVTTLGVIRSLASSGIPSAVVAHRPEVVERSRWYRPAPAPLRAATPASLATALEAAPYERAVLIPCSDHWLAATAALPDALSARYASCVPSSRTVATVTDKGAFAAALREAEISHPRTEEQVRPEVLDALPEAFFEHAFLKPHDSQAFLARHGVKAVWIRSADEANRRARELADAGFAMALQEYVPGPASHHVFVDGFADRDSQVPCVFARRRLRMFPTDFGNSTYQVSIAPDACAPAVDAVRRLVRHLGYVGVFSVEFKQDARDGTYRMLELNARPWWYVDFAARAGIDVVRLAYQAALGLPLDLPREYRPGSRCIYPYYDYFACRERTGSALGGALRCAAATLGARQPVWRLSDPLPALRGAFDVLWGRLRRTRSGPRSAIPAAPTGTAEHRP